MKATYEKVPRARGQLFVGVRREPAFAPFWHFHPEHELTLIVRGRGRRFVGDHVDLYRPGDLVLHGPELPHGYTSAAAGQGAAGAASKAVDEAIFVQFDTDLLGPGRLAEPAFRPLRRLLERARVGLVFGAPVRNEVARQMRALPGLTPLGQLAEALLILDRLAGDEGAAPLSSRPFVPSYGADGQHPLERACRHLDQRFTTRVTLAETARVAAMSPSAFSRYFHRSTGQTFSSYVTALRLTRACGLLVETDLPIARAAEEAGFSNLALFNRQFLRRKKMRPREYRDEFRRSHRDPASSRQV